MDQAKELKRLKSRFDAIWQERKNDMDDHCKQIALHVLPVAMRAIGGDKSHDRAAHRKIVDSTGKESLKILAAGMLSGTCSPSRPWFVLNASDLKLKKDIEVKQWLDTVKDVMYAEFAKSNVYRAVHHCYMQECAFGTGAALMPETGIDEPLMSLIPLTFGEYALTTDSYNRPNGIFREFELTVENIVDRFGLKNVSEAIQNQFEQEKYDKVFKIKHVIERRVNPDSSDKTSKGKPWASYYFEENAQDQFLSIGGFDYFAAVCPRWNVTGIDTYGESPASDAIGDMSALQKAHAQLAKGTDYAINPPLLLPASLKGQERQVLPNGLAFYDPMPGVTGQQVHPMLTVKPDYQGVFMIINAAQERVRKTFHADLFLMMDNFDKTNMTATEVAERKNEKMLLLGPILDRQNDELLRPLVERCFARVMERYPELLEEAPEQAQAAEIKIEFVSILAQAQRAAGSATLERLLAMVGQLAQFDQGIMDKFDSAAFLDTYADINGAPAAVLRGEKKIKELQQAREQQQAQMQAMQQAQVESQAGLQDAQATKALTEAAVTVDPMADPAAGVV